MQAYITSIGAITPQDTVGGDFACTKTRDACKHSCIEPDYKTLIPPVQLRRMPRVLKLSLGASRLCLNALPDVAPEGIVVGTGLACLNETETFMHALFNDGEQSLSPLPFINSPNNIIAGHIARLSRNHSYNCTHCSRGVSFESALIDALMLLNEGKAANVLVGGVDEMAEHYHVLLERAGELPPCGEGEGAVFFMLGKDKSDRALARVAAVQTYYCPTNDIVADFLSAQKLEFADVDALLLGNNGDKTCNTFYRSVCKHFPLRTHLGIWKHLCGEYMTSTAFALALAAHSVKNGAFPSVCLSNPEDDKPLRRILIANHYRNQNFSLMLVESV